MQLVGENTEERGLAETVQTDEGGFFTTFDCQINMFEQKMIRRVSKGCVLQGDDILSGTRRDGQTDFRRLDVNFRHFDVFQPIEHFLTALSLRGLCGLVFETVDEGFDLFAFSIQILLLREKLFVAGFAVTDVLVVIAWITGDDAAHDFHRDVRQGVEEIAVM